MFLVDASQSVPRELQGPALDYVSAASRKRRKDDLAGVIVYGKSPSVETPPAPTEVNLLGIESTIDSEYTDLASAIEHALAAKKLGVQVDVLPLEYHYDREVLVEKVSIPPDVKKGEMVNINVV